MTLPLPEQGPTRVAAGEGTYVNWPVGAGGKATKAFAAFVGPFV
jgi:hypothetical protein